MQPCDAESGIQGDTGARLIVRPTRETRSTSTTTTTMPSARHTSAPKLGLTASRRVATARSTKTGPRGNGMTAPAALLARSAVEAGRQISMARSIRLKRAISATPIHRAPRANTSGSGLRWFPSPPRCSYSALRFLGSAVASNGQYPHGPGTQRNASPAIATRQTDGNDRCVTTSDSRLAASYRNRATRTRAGSSGSCSRGARRDSRTSKRPPPWGRVGVVREGIHARGPTKAASPGWMKMKGPATSSAIANQRR